MRVATNGQCSLSPLQMFQLLPPPSRVNSRGQKQLATIGQCPISPMLTTPRASTSRLNRDARRRLHQSLQRTICGANTRSRSWQLFENGNQVKDFRPIAVLPVIYKLYSRVMYMLAETACSHLVAAQFAFRKYHQAHEVVFIIRQLVEKAVEWRAPQVYIMDGDIKKAYDYVSHSAFATAARKRGMHEVLIHAWLREWRRMTSVFRLDAETTSDKVTRTRSLPQGDLAAPMIFNVILDSLGESSWLRRQRRAGAYGSATTPGRT